MTYEISQGFDIVAHAKPLIPIDVAPFQSRTEILVALETCLQVKITTGLMLSFNISISDSVITSIQPSSGVSKNVQVLTSNTWAEIAKEEEEAAKTMKTVKSMKKCTKTIPGIRTRRVHDSIPQSSRKYYVGMSEGSLTKIIEIPCLIILKWSLHK